MCLEFIGVAKTAIKNYLMQHLSSVELANRGDYLSMLRMNDVGRHEMTALVWMDRERRYFISTTSSCLPGNSCNRVLWRQLEDGLARVEMNVPTPKICEIYYSACSRIDHYNRSRQDDLKLERKIETKDWSFRVNTTLVSM